MFQCVHNILILQGKESTNSENVYSQNHDGVYCICHRPYPDPDNSDKEQDEMIQCCSCEDWFHSKVSRARGCTVYLYHQNKSLVLHYNLSNTRKARPNCTNN